MIWGIEILSEELEYAEEDIQKVRDVAEKYRQYFSQNRRIKAWCNMSYATYQLLLEKGELQVPKSFAQDEWFNFERAYDWMIRLMDRVGLKPPINDISPWWFWLDGHCAQEATPVQQDMPEYEDGCAVQLSLPASEVLLSDFDLWHYVINGWYLGKGEEDSSEFDALCEALGSEGYFHDCPSEELRQRMLKGWLKIFDLEFTGNGYYCNHGMSEKSIQGNIWTLKKEYVEKVYLKSELPLAKEDEDEDD